MTSKFNNNSLFLEAHNMPQNIIFLLDSTHFSWRISQSSEFDKLKLIMERLSREIFLNKNNLKWNSVTCSLKNNKCCKWKYMYIATCSFQFILDIQPGWRSSQWIMNKRCLHAFHWWSTLNNIGAPFLEIKKKKWKDLGMIRFVWYKPSPFLFWWTVAPVATLDGHTSITVRFSKTQSTHTDDMSLQFRTPLADALLFETKARGNNKHVKVYLEGGRIKFETNIGGEKKVSLLRALVPIHLLQLSMNSSLLIHCLFVCLWPALANWLHSQRPSSLIAVKVWHETKIK